MPKQSTLNISPTANGGVVTSTVPDPVISADANGNMLITPQAPVLSFKENASSGGGTTPVDPPPASGNPAGVPANVKQIFAKDFQSGLAPMQTTQMTNPTQALIPDPLDASKQVFQAVVLAGQTAVSSGFRSELIPPANYPGDSGEMYYSYDHLCKQLDDAANENGHISQWHPGSSTGSAAVALYAGGGILQVVVNPTGNSNIYPPKNQTVSTIFNKWQRNLWHINWSSGNDGFIFWYLDGKLIFEYHGPTQNNTGVSFKMGINHFTASGKSPSTTWRMLYNNLWIGQVPKAA